MTDTSCGEDGSCSSGVNPDLSSRLSDNSPLLYFGLSILLAAISTCQRCTGSRGRSLWTQVTLKMMCGRTTRQPQHGPNRLPPRCLLSLKRSPHCTLNVEACMGRWSSPPTSTTLEGVAVNGKEKEGVRASSGARLRVARSFVESLSA